MKKYAAASILLALCLLLAGCSSSEPSKSGYTDITPSEVVTGAINAAITGKEDKVIFTISNSGSEAYDFYNDFQVEVKRDDGWYTIPYKSNFEYPVNQLQLSAGGMVQDFVYLGDLDYKLKSGEQYRVIKYIPYFLVAAEFTVA